MKWSSQTMPFPQIAAPPMARITQKLPSAHIEDPRGEVSWRLTEFGLRDKVTSGNRVAITAGSRGIGGFVDILSGVVAAVKACGGEPFLFPAMGSHGGATPEGQVEILRRLGVTDQSIGAPIHATMETRELGSAPNGATAHADRLAAEADGVIVVGRTKTHPESVGELASGLLKMCTIGLGKQAGAQQAHSHGLWDSVRQASELQLEKVRILCGVAVVENGYRQPCAIEVVPPRYQAFLETDMRLLRLAKQHLARIPFEALDLLIVDELGKNISGGGMDPNIIGLWRNSDAPHVPDFKRIAALSLTYPSLGNGLGIGMADFTTRRFVEAYNQEVTYVNLLTATEPGGNTREGPLPLALATDREAIEVALYSALATQNPRVCRIKNTAMLDDLWVSPALLEEVKRNAKLDVVHEPTDLPFDAKGNLF